MQLLRRGPSRAFLAAALALVASAAAQHEHGHAPAALPAAVPAPPGPVDLELTLGVRRGLLRYDQELLLARPGARLRVRLVNGDDMLHNWVLCRPGTDLDGLTAAALQLGERALARAFVPEAASVLCHTGLAEPGRSAAVEFTVPAAEGDYPFVCTVPGHAAFMRGVLRVTAAAHAVAGLRYACYAGAFERLPDFATLEPTRRGELADGLIDLGVADRAEDFALVFEGALRVPTAGSYRIHLDSDDGARVLIAGQVVVEHDGVHGAGAERSGAIELAAGSHSLRVEYFQHLGDRALQVSWSGGAQPRLRLTRGGDEAADPRQELVVLDTPVVQRAFVEGGPLRGIAVGLPGGVAYLFDPERGCVAFGWRGGFLDVGPDRTERGGRPCRLLGQRFGVGEVGFPLRLAGEAGRGQCTGYRLEPAGPRFTFTIAGRELAWQVLAAPRGLRYAFTMSGEPCAVEFRVRRDEVDARSAAGTWDGDVLRIPAAAAARFTIDLEPRT